MTELIMKDAEVFTLTCPVRACGSPLVFTRATAVDRGESKGMSLNLIFLCKNKHIPVYRVHNSNGSSAVIEARSAWPPR